MYHSLVWSHNKNIDKCDSDLSLILLPTCNNVSRSLPKSLIIHYNWVTNKRMTSLASLASVVYPATEKHRVLAVRVWARAWAGEQRTTGRILRRTWKQNCEILVCISVKCVVLSQLSATVNSLIWQKHVFLCLKPCFTFLSIREICLLGKVAIREISIKLFFEQKCLRVK